MNGRESGRLGIVARGGRTGRIGNLASDIGDRGIAARDGFRATVSAASTPLVDFAKGRKVKLARMLSTIGIIAALAGCKTSWIDRDDDRPMKYASARDCLSYGWWGECFHPKYHCGPPDGIRDHVSVKKAAIKAANRSLSEQNCGATSRDFRYGFQQAYIDIANGGSGVLPAVPPPRYWAAPYRTTWGHNKAREWFSGYEAGANSAKCCMPGNTLSVPTSVYRSCDNQQIVGLNGAAIAPAPISTGNYAWPNNGMTAYPGNSMMSNPYPMSSYGGAMAAPTVHGGPPMTTYPPMTAPNSYNVPGNAWSNGSSPVLPSNPAPTYSAPIPPLSEPSGGGHSIPIPGHDVLKSPTNLPVTPMHGQTYSPPASVQNGYTGNHPWRDDRGMSPMGFKPVGGPR